MIIGHTSAPAPVCPVGEHVSTFPQRSHVPPPSLVDRRASTTRWVNYAIVFVIILQWVPCTPRPDVAWASVSLATPGVARADPEPVSATTDKDGRPDGLRHDTSRPQARTASSACTRQAGHMVATAALVAAGEDGHETLRHHRCPGAICDDPPSLSRSSIIGEGCRRSAHPSR